MAVRKKKSREEKYREQVIDHLVGLKKEVDEAQAKAKAAKAIYRDAKKRLKALEREELREPTKKR